MSGSSGDGINVNVTADTSDLDSALQASADRAQTAFRQVGAAAESGGAQVTATLRQLQASLASAQAQYASFGGAAKAAIGEYVDSLQKQIASMSAVQTSTAAMAASTQAAAGATSQAAQNMTGLNGAFQGLDRTVTSAADSARVFAAALSTTAVSSAELVASQSAAQAALAGVQTTLQDGGIRLLSAATASRELAASTGAVATQTSVATASLGRYIDTLMGVNVATLSARESAAAFTQTQTASAVEELIVANNVARTSAQLQNMGVRLNTARAATAVTTGSISELGSRVQTVANGELQGLIERLTGVTTSSGTTATAARTLGSTMTETGGAAKTTAGRARDLAEAFGGTATKSHMTSGAMHEVVVEAHELMTGNFSRMPGTTLTLANRMSGLTTNIMLAVGALGALALAASEAITWLSRLSDAKANASAGGSLYNPSLGEKAINGMVGDAHRLSGLAEDVAIKLPAIFARMPGATEPAIRAMLGMVKSLSLGTGQSAEEIAKKLADAYGNGGQHAISLMDSLQVATMRTGDATSKTFGDAYREALQANDATRQRVLLLQALGQATTKAESQSRPASDRTSTFDKFTAAVGSSPDVSMGNPDPEAAIREQNERLRAEREKNLRDAQAQAPADQSDGTNPGAFMQAQRDRLAAQRQADSASLDLEHMGSDARDQLRLHQAQADAEFWKDVVGRTREGSSERVAAEREYTQAAERLGMHNASEHDRLMREQTAGVNRETAEWIRNTKDALQAQILASHASLDLTHMDAHARETVRLQDAKNTVAFWKNAVETTKAGTKEQTAAREEMMRAQESLDMQMLSQHDRLARAGTASAKKSLEEQIAALSAQQAANKNDFNEVMNLETQKLALIEKALGQRSVMYQNELRHEAQLRNEHEAELNKIDQDRISKAQQGYQTELSGMTRTLNAQVAVGRQTRDQAVQQLVDFVEKNKAEQLKMLDDYIATLTKGTLAYEKALGQRKLLETKFNTEISALQAQAASAAERLQQQAVSHMGQLFDNMYRTGSSAISGLITHTETWGSAAKKVLSGMISDVANAGLHMLGSWITTELAKTATTETQAAIRKAQDAGGTGFFALIAGWLGFEQTKTAISAQGTAQRATVETSGGFLSRIGSWIASWFGFESTKTAVTGTQTAARTATQAAADTERAVQTGALNAASALSYAAVGAVAAGASVAAIPITGWAMAPEVAGATYGYLAGMAGLTSLDVGAWNVPRDMVANIHQGEMVVPRDFASGMRSSTMNTQTSSSTMGDMHYSPTINAGGGSTSEIAAAVRRNGRDMMGRVQQIVQPGSFVLPGRSMG